MRVVPFNYLSGRDTFTRIREHTAGLFMSQSHTVDTGNWQGRETQGKPDLVTHELMNYTFTHALGGTGLDEYREDVKPNLPWADDHFEERVCGAPINPGVEWENWPWSKSADTFRGSTGMFGHNYMERFWPKLAGMSGPCKTADEFRDNLLRVYPNGGEHSGVAGIRNPYGDLNDLVEQLAKKPMSRQEWFPIFHPEDVGETVDGRKPCSLGYQFWVRDSRLHMYYPLRSCDFYRHMQDDIYLAIRMLLWVLEKCQSKGYEVGYPDWSQVVPGTLTMHCTSLHIFANDMAKIKQGEY